VRSWKRWEAGDAEPDAFYKPLIAQTFGTVTAAFFPKPSQRDAEQEILNGTGLDRAQRLAAYARASEVDLGRAGEAALLRASFRFPPATPEDVTP